MTGLDLALKLGPVFLKVRRILSYPASWNYKSKTRVNLLPSLCQEFAASSTITQLT